MLLIPAKNTREAAEALSRELAKGPIQLLFVCTHNSRRSQLAEASAAWLWRGNTAITVRSCGTERTGCHPSTARALEDSGWVVSPLQDGHYRIQKDEVDRLLYSKTLEEIPRDLPIVAMMTCAEADEACPAIFGAVARIPWRYPDPKVADGTDECAATYLQVAKAIEADLQDLVNQTNSAR